MNDQISPSGEALCHGMTGSSGQVNGGRDDPHHKKSNIRKRTKTGCLTCRKRRIKCDEGRPTCNNCIKSKRHCEGYNQRVIFKPSLGVQSHPLQDHFNSLSYLHGPGHPLNHFGSLLGRPSGHGALPNLAPKPPSSVEYMPISHTQNYGPQYHGQPNQSTFHAVGPNSHLFHQNIPENFLPSNIVPGFGMVDHFQPSGLQSPDTHQPYGHPLQPKEAAAYATSSGPNNMAVASAHRAHVSDTPSYANMKSTEVKKEHDDIRCGDSHDDHGNCTALVAPVAGGLYRPVPKEPQGGSLDDFASVGAVTEYLNSPNLSELRNRESRQIFEHFMRVTGPSMSLYERHPFDTSERELSGLNPGSETNMWSYTFPVISFHEPGLLHAMLASASLQVAKLQGAPATAAMRHYAYAIRHIATNVRTPSKRTHPATLAATLLLGYFEVWNGDHNTWCNHLYGARILFTEIPLRAMSKRCLPAKNLRERQMRMKKMGMPPFEAQLPQDHDGLNYQLLSLMTGYEVSAADYGMTEDHILCSDHSATTERDIRNYENLRDLFWWYCKMDVYQSILGGTPLFMEYEDWMQCPPRAPASRLDSIYGTYDHLMLLLGRLVNFAAKDLSRKRRQHQQRGHHRDASPPFPGMIPTKGEFQVPMGFSPPKHEPQPDPTEGMDPEASLQAASKEWEAIRNAFSCFEHHLGPEFQPLGPEYTDRRDYPFGPALQYVSFSVAGIWMNYYMGLIHLYRSHPIMPPAAMASVGLAASNTYEFANRLGRIAVGLSDNFDNVNEVSTVMAAALIESAFCLFVASVQYQDDDQRRWVVKRMLDITRLTGWQSARQIAEGCEASWTKCAEMGQGPRYNRMAMPPAPPEIVWHNVRRIDRKIHEGDDRAEEKRLILARSERAQYALGLLGIEADMEFLELKDHAFSRTV